MNSVDVVVPCHQYGRFLPQCVSSVLSQPIDDLRVLIIDDASPDNTAEVATELISRDSRVELLRHKANRGHIATYNEGIEWASADYMLLLSADDVLMPGALPRAAKLMERHQEIGMTYGRIIYFSDDYPVDRLFDGNLALDPCRVQKATIVVSGARSLAMRWPGRGSSRSVGSLADDRAETRYKILDGADFMRSNRHANQVHTATTVVRTELQRKIGGYKKELPHAGDLEMWFRFAVHAPVGYIDSYQAAARMHEHNMSKELYGDTIFDLEQRKCLLDSIFAEYRDRIENRAALEMDLYRGLAEVSVRAAGAPFSAGDAIGCERLLEFAKRVHPPISTSLIWKAFVLKKSLGPNTYFRISTIMRPLAARLFGFEG
jgi:glycosyltransferase involved in cell wall biosynthesis